MEKKPYHILFIEDSSDSAAFMVALLENRGQLTLSHRQVNTQADLTNALQSQNWDMILCDLNMPLLDIQLAIDLCQTHQSDTPIILVSGQSSTAEVVDMIRKGDYAYVDKSDHDRLVNIVKHELAMQDRQKRLLQREKYYQSIVNNQREFICRYNTNHELTFVNRAYCEWQGLSADDLIGENLITKIPEDQRELALAHISKINKDNPLSISLHQSIMPDGDVRWIEWSDTAIFDDNDNIIEYQGVGRDITERKTVEDALRQSEARLNEAQRIAHIGNWERDLITNELYWSDEVYRIFGLDKTQHTIHKDLFYDAILPKDEAMVREAMERALEQNIPYAIDHRIIRPDGDIRTVHDRSEIIHDEDGTPLRLVGTVQDVTQQRQMEDALRDSEERYRHLVENTPNGILIHHNDVIRYINTAGATILGGKNPKDIVGKSIYDFIREEDREQVEARKIRKLDGELLPAHERQLVLLDGSLVDVEVVGMRTDYNGDPAIQVVFSDITDRKQAEQALRNRERLLESLINSQTNYVMRTDLAGYYTYCNPKFIEEFGWLYGDSDIEGAFSLDSIMDYHHQLCFETVKKCLRNPGEIVTVEIDKPTQDGGVCTTIWEFVCLTDDDGQPSEIQCMGIDITQRKQAEIALQENEERYRMISELMADSAALIEIDENGNAYLIWTLGQLVDVAQGYDEGTFASLSDIAEFDHPDDREMVQLERQQTINGEETLSEYRSLTKDGRYHWLSVKRKPIWDENAGRYTHYMAIIKDITAEKFAELALQENEKRYRTISELMTDSATLFEIDENQQAKRIWTLGINTDVALGYEAGTFSSMGKIGEYDHPDDRDTVKQARQATINGQVTFNEFRVRAKDGHYHWFSVNRKPIWDDEEGRYTHYIAAVKDIHAQKEAELALRKSEKRFKTISELMSDTAIEYEFDEEGNGKLSWRIGQEIYSVLGHDPTSINSITKGMEYIHPDDREMVQASIKKTRAGTQTEDEYRMRSSDGTYKWFSCSRQPIFADEGDNVTGYVIALNDVTEQKESDLALRESEQRFRIISELMSDTAIEYRFDASGDMKRVWSLGLNLNDILGYKGRKFESIRTGINNVHPDDREIVLEAVKKARLGIATQDEYRMSTSDGGYKWFASSRQPIFADNDVTGYMIVLNDVTEQKEADIALRESEQRFRVISELMSDSASQFHVDEDGSVTKLWELGIRNDVLLGYDGNQFTSVHSGYSITHPDDRESLRQAVSRTLEGYETSNEFRLRDANGHYHWFLASRKPIWNSDGTRVTDYVIAMKNITEQKKAIEALKISEKRHRQMFESIGLPQLVLDVDNGNIIDANPAAVTTYGYSLDDLTTMNISDINKLSLDEIRHKFKQVTSGEIDTCDCVHVDANGNVIDVEVFLCDIQWNDRLAIYSVYVDVTQRNKAERDLKQLNETLEQQVKRRTLELEATKNQTEAVFNNSSDGILLFDIEYGIIQANTTCDILFGAEFESYKYTPLQSLFVGDDQTKVIELVQTAIETTVSEAKELRIRSGNGFFYAEVTIATIPQMDGFVTQLVCTIHDVTERKQAEQAVAEERNLLRTLIDAVSEYIYVKDNQHRIIISNLAHTRSTGYDNPIDVVGKTDHDFAPVELADNFKRDEEELFASGKPLYDKEERTVGADGNLIWALTSKIPLKGVDGTLRGLVGITKDITSLKEQEEALRQSEKRLRESQNMLRLVLDAIPVRVFWKDRNSVYLGGNNLFLKDTNFSTMDEIIGKTDKDLFPKEANMYMKDDRDIIISGESYIDFDEYQIMHDGNAIWKQVSKIPLRNPDGDIIGVLGTYTDITERKKAEEQLRYLAEIQEQMQDAVIGLDAEFKIRSWNSAATDMYGWSADEVIGEPLNTFTKTEYPSMQNRDESLSILMRDGVWRDEVIQYHRDGTPIHVLSSVVLQQDENGEVIGYIGVNHDYTERKKAQEIIAESEARYRLLAENVSDIIMRHTADGLITYVSPSVYRQIGFTAEEIIGRYTTEFIFPDDIQRNTVWHMDVTDRPDTYTNMYRVMHKNGDLIWVETTSTQRYEGGDLVEIISVTRDITERREAEAELRAISQRLELATNAGGIGVWELNMATGKLYWDEQMLKLYGLSADQFNGKLSTWASLIHPDDLDWVNQLVRDTVNGDTEFNGLVRIVRPTGETRSLQVFSQTDRGQDNKPQRIVGINMDVTEIREAAQALMSALEQEKELGELKSRFVSMASHEFRTPLAGILATVETLTRFRNKMNDAQLDERLDKIRIQVNHMKNMMDDVLRLARLQSGRMVVRLASHDFDDLCREIIEELRTQPKFKERIDYQCTAPVPLMMDIDRQLMRQVVMNLTHNALKYSEEYVEVQLSKTDKYLKLVIRDRGIGIPEADLKRLFEPFHRATNVGTRQGTGLGLSIVKQAIDAHHGTIDVNSEVGVGTTFTVTMRLKG